VIRIVTKADLQSGNVTVNRPVNSWKFTCSDVPDVAFGISDHFVWDGASTVVDDATGRRATGYAAYNDTTVDYPHIARFAKDALRWFSKNWPGVPYPYEKTTVFQGYAGMEYPMMANDETTADTNFSRFVAEHEIVHRAGRPHSNTFGIFPRWARNAPTSSSSNSGSPAGPIINLLNCRSRSSLRAMQWRERGWEQMRTERPHWVIWR
jgi:hypothetical protein